GRSYEVRAFPYEDGLSVYFTDLTEQRGQEAQLHLLRRAVEASSSGIIVTDSVQADDPIVYVNPGFTAITGYRPDEVIGRNCRFLQGDSHDQEGLDELRWALHERRPTSVVVRNYRKDGTSFCNELHVAPVEGEDGLLHHVGVILDVTERVESEQRQREATEALRGLTQRLVDVQEQERRSLALELHDEIGQVLTALKFTLDHADRAPTTPSGLLSGAREMVRGLQDQVRDLSLDLRPSMLDDFGLLPALVWLFERTERQMGLTVRFTAPEHLPPLSADRATAAFRIVQEALTNVVRHAGVAEATVDLRVEGDRLVLDVGDHGPGFDPGSTHPSSSGLSGMRERAHLLGGTVTVEPRSDGGTCVRARLPLAP
ncbi:MAG TPA: PAS domain S-box protein, partial [Rubricoccaceae bacterium]